MSKLELGIALQLVDFLKEVRRVNELVDTPDYKSNLTRLVSKYSILIKEEVKRKS